MCELRSGCDLGVGGRWETRWLSCAQCSSVTPVILFGAPSPQALEIKRSLPSLTSASS